MRDRLTAAFAGQLYGSIRNMNIPFGFTLTEGDVSRRFYALLNTIHFVGTGAVLKYYCKSR